MHVPNQAIISTVSTRNDVRTPAHGVHLPNQVVKTNKSTPNFILAKRFRMACPIEMAMALNNAHFGLEPSLSKSKMSTILLLYVGIGMSLHADCNF